MNRILSKREDSLSIKLLPIITTLLFIFILLVQTHGRIVVGGDFAGYYDFRQALSQPHFQSILYGFALLLTFNNIYISYYLYLFIGVLINLYALTYLLKNIGLIRYKSYVNAIVLITTYLSFIFNISSLRAARLSAYEPAILNYSALALFLAFILSDESKKIDLTRPKNILLILYIIIVISLTPFPNNVRYAALLTLLALVTSITMFLFKNRYYLYTLIKRILVILLPLYLLTFISILPELNHTITVARAAMHAHGYNMLHAPYAKPINVLRMLGNWAFQTAYAPYHYLYFGGNVVITLLSFIYPLCLGISLLFLLKEENKDLKIKLTIFILLSILTFSWDLADNSAIGSINIIISRIIPYIVAIFRPSFLSIALMRVIISVLFGYCTYKFLNIRRKAPGLLLVVFIIVAIIIADFPLLNGSAIAEYWNPSIKGIKIPNEYFKVKHILLTELGPDIHNDVILVYPAHRTYVKFAWGYQGSVIFLNRFFYPLNLLTLASFGGYSEYTKFTEYLNITIPDIKLTGINYLENNIKSIKGYGVKVERVNDDKLYLIFSRNISKADVVISFNRSIDASNYTFIGIDIKSDNTSILYKLIKDNKIWIGISSPKVAGWYLLGIKNFNKYVKLNHSELLIVLRVGENDKPWPTSYYNKSDITGIIIRFTNLNKVSLNITRITISLKLFYAKSYLLHKSYLESLKSYNIKYILLDKSMIEGTIGQLKYYKELIEIGEKEGILENIYSGNYLELYKIVFVNSNGN